MPVGTLLRSAGIALTMVSIASAIVSVVLDAPILFLLLAVIGTFVGIVLLASGILSFYLDQSKRSPDPDPPTQQPGHLNVQHPAGVRQ